MNLKQSPWRRGRWFAYLELVRLPNLFTAMADVAMGFLVTQGSLQLGLEFFLLVTASGSLYLAGMILNDVFDVEQDAQDRPHRPIPSGRVSLATARRLGWGLLGSGMLVAWLVSFLASDWRPGAIGLVLAICIGLYDSLLKQTPLAPILMGTCRLLNVLLGMSLARSAATDLPRSWSATEWSIAIGLGVYVAGITQFARTEARTSSRWQLLGGTAILLGGLGILASFPSWQQVDRKLTVTPEGWVLLWAVLALVIGRRCARAVVHPTPKYVQAAVRHGILSIILLDAALSLGFAGPYWGCAVLLLLAPTWLLGQWMDST